jgi:hypothetical protein
MQEENSDGERNIVMHSVVGREREREREREYLNMKL